MTKFPKLPHVTDTNWRRWEPSAQLTMVGHPLLGCRDTITRHLDVLLFNGHIQHWLTSNASANKAQRLFVKKTFTISKRCDNYLTYLIYNRTIRQQTAWQTGAHQRCLTLLLSRAECREEELAAQPSPTWATLTANLHAHLFVSASAHQCRKCCFELCFFASFLSPDK